MQAENNVKISFILNILERKRFDLSSNYSSLKTISVGHPEQCCHERSTITETLIDLLMHKSVRN